MAPTPDPVSILQRLAALSGAGRAIPDDLARAALDWLTDSAPAILAGEPVAQSLGLAARRGAWQAAPVHRARFDRRDAALRELWNLTEGDDQARTWQVQEWLYQWQTFTGSRLTGPQVRRLLAAVPDNARLHLDAIADTGLRIPEKRAFQRVVRAASRNPVGAGGCDSLPVSALPVAAITSTRP